MNSQKIRISVVGGSSCTPDIEEDAYEVGREIAKKDAILICGGLSGVMQHAARGAKDEGGITVGILPGNDPQAANPYIDIPITTGLGEARNVIVASSGDAVIAIDGSLGTLTEILFALKRNIPVIGIKTWELDKERAGGAEIANAESPKEAVEMAYTEVGKRLRL